MNAKNKKLLAKMKKNNAKIKKVKNTSILDRHKRKKRIELLIICMAFILILSFIGFMFSPYVKLKNITVSGTNQLLEEEILKAGNIDNNVKTWTIKDEEVENKIKNSSNIIKNVKVKSKMLSTIEIQVEEYKIIAKNRTKDGNYETIIENGEIFNGEIRNNYNIPIIENFEDSKEKKEDVYRNLSKLKAEILREISEVINDKDSKENIVIYMRDGQKVKALSASFSEKLNYYNEIAAHIKDKDKSKTVLNLINGSYLETESSVKEKEKKINELLGTNSSDSKKTEENNSTNSEKSLTNSNNSQSNNDKKNNKTVESKSETTSQVKTTKKKYSPTS